MLSKSRSAVAGTICMFTRVQQCFRVVTTTPKRYIRIPVPRKPSKAQATSSGNDGSNHAARSLAMSLDKPSQGYAAGREQSDEGKGSKVSPTLKSKKLSRGLEKKYEQDLSPEGIGVLDTIGTDISEVLNEALASSSAFYEMIPGSKQAGDVIEIQHVKVNKDCSHIMAYWTAPFISNFVNLIKTQRGAAESERMHLKMSRTMSLRLQKREPQFRSYLIKKMEFRRVPRITFSEYTIKVVNKLKQKRTGMFLANLD